MRSKLFVPGTRPELFGKALAGAADAVSFDLEDAVPEDRKDQARADVAAFVRTDAARTAAKLVIVRINALDTPHFERDVDALAGAGLGLLNLPKTEYVEDVRAAVAALERAETAHGVTTPVRLLVNIETPRGLRDAAAIASAHPRVAGLQLGLADLFEPHGIARRDAANVHAALFAMRLAAAQAGVFAVDAAYADIHDEEGFRVEAAMAHRLGYVGKSCIHPRQVALANAAFRPGDDEIEAARRIVASAGDALSRGVGAFVVDGRMIDLPFLKRAQALVASVDGAQGSSR